MITLLAGLALGSVPSFAHACDEFGLIPCGGKSVIELLAYNDNGASEAARFPVNWQGQRDFFKPDLYVLAVGVSSYREKSLKLDYAAKDARDFVRAIKRQKGSIYKKVHVNLLDDSKATRNAIEKGLEWLEKQQVLDGPADWRESRPDLEPGGWAFQFKNSYYVDLDDTSARRLCDQGVAVG